MKLWLCLTIVLISQFTDIAESFKISYTLGDEIQCMTACVNNGGRSDCFIGYNEKRQCIEGRVEAPLALTHQKEGNIPRCTSICGKYGETYDWCFTGQIGGHNWDRCIA